MPQDRHGTSPTLGHYAQAKRLLALVDGVETGVEAIDDGGRPIGEELALRYAQVEATLYLGEQLEAIAGLLAGAGDGHRGIDPLTREELGLEPGETPR